ncbi:22.7 kDa class IV heat shock protein [Linum grandiflorum]
MKKEDVKIEVEENRVLRISGDKWHRAERTCGKFWRQFRLPGNADLDKINASLQDGLLTVIVPKLADENKRQAKVITIVDDKPSSSSSSSSSSSAHNIEPTKASA